MRSTTKFLFLLCVILLTACGPGKPGDAFQKYSKEAMEGDYEDGSRYFCVDGNPLNFRQDSLLQVVLKGYYADMEEKFQGLKKTEVVDQQVQDGGQRADIRVRLYFGDGTEEETEYEMCLVENKWKINLLE